jgi:hypothetical protein
MTLLGFDGFQNATSMVKPEWGSAVMLSSAGRDGSTNGGATSNSVTTWVYTLPSTAAVCIWGIAYNFSGSGSLSSANNFWAFRDTAGTAQIAVFVNTSGFIEIRRTNRAGTLLATSTGHTAIGQSAFHYYEIKVGLSTVSATVTVRLDGVQVATFTGVTSSLTSDVKTVAVNVGTGTSAVQFDDLYVCDAVDATATQGQPNDDFLGDLKVQTLFPSADGDTTQFTPSTGTNHAALVDENPLTTTDYNQDAIVGERDMYQLDDLPSGTSTVFGLRLGLYALKSDIGTRLVKPLLKESGGTITTDTAQGLSTVAAGVFGSIRAAKPSTGGAWTAADVNALQAGAEVA